MDRGLIDLARRFSDCGITGAPAAQEMCWEMKHGYNAVKGMLRAPKTEKRPDVFYFGESEAMEACLARLEQEDECAAFTWMGKNNRVVDGSVDQSGPSSATVAGAPPRRCQRVTGPVAWVRGSAGRA